uniref:Uncharacterized protein n=1 Tax=viral metagenome TaxID=1070528 RepID=A0A6M3LAD3_9ZZZZ
MPGWNGKNKDMDGPVHYIVKPAPPADKTELETELSPWEVEDRLEMPDREKIHCKVQNAGKPILDSPKKPPPSPTSGKRR